MINIDRLKCNGCKQLDTPQCVDICPGNLLYLDEEEKAEIYDPFECWDCFACVKACPRRAISLQLPFQISENLLQVISFHRKKDTVWEVRDENGKIVERFCVPSCTK